MFQAQTLPCSDCGGEFVFTVEEQEFFNEKGFNPPRRCKPCREAAKAAKRSGGGFGGGRGGFGGGRGGFGGEREFFDAVCSGCGANTQVPFRPDGRKPVYCKPCFQSQRAY
ncbi:MAG: CxxC-x17-CxxC domain-containing protein [Vampirovibrionales bacterium]|nr:CxxC-x17-CxxC domain-containing protein [Vampirovibrionales bacterium]